MIFPHSNSIGQSGLPNAAWLDVSSLGHYSPFNLNAIFPFLMRGRRDALKEGKILENEPDIASKKVSELLNVLNFGSLPWAKFKLCDFRISEPLLV